MVLGLRSWFLLRLSLLLVLALTLHFSLRYLFLSPGLLKLLDPLILLLNLLLEIINLRHQLSQCLLKILKCLLKILIHAGRLLLNSLSLLNLLFLPFILTGRHAEKFANSVHTVVSKVMHPVAKSAEDSLLLIVNFLGEILLLLLRKLLLALGSELAAHLLKTRFSLLLLLFEPFVRLLNLVQERLFGVVNPL